MPKRSLFFLILITGTLYTKIISHYVTEQVISYQKRTVTKIKTCLVKKLRR